MFKSPEHALSVAFAIMERRLEPKCATLLVIESMRSKKVGEPASAPAAMTQHEWRAQAVQVLGRAELAMQGRPELWQTIVAEYCHGPKGALAIQAVSEVVEPGLESSERLLMDFLTMHAFRAKPPLRQLTQEFGVPLTTLHRRKRQVEESVAKLRHQAIERLMSAFSDIITTRHA